MVGGAEFPGVLWFLSSFTATLLWEARDGARRLLLRDLELEPGNKQVRARLAALKRERAPILCSDTTVALGRRILGKPADAAQATETLAALSGRTHRVITAVAVAAGRREWLAVSSSRVHFAAMPPREIERYVASGEPFGKAGAYAIQSAVAAWIARIEGSYSGIMGLPLYETTQLLRRARVRF